MSVAEFLILIIICVVYYYTRPRWYRNGQKRRCCCCGGGSDRDFEERERARRMRQQRREREEAEARNGAWQVDDDNNTFDEIGMADGRSSGSKIHDSDDDVELAYARSYGQSTSKSGKARGGGKHKGTGSFNVDASSVHTVQSSPGENDVEEAAVNPRMYR